MIKRSIKNILSSKYISHYALLFLVSSIVSEVNKTVFFFYKTYFKTKIHKTIASN